MDNSINSVFTILIFGCGVYCLYQAIMLFRTGKVPENSIVLSKDRPMSRCLDPEAFVTYIKPRFLIFAIAVTIFAAISLVNDLTDFMGVLTAGLSQTMQLVIVEIVSVGIPIAVIIWFAVCLVRIQKKLW